MSRCLSGRQICGAESLEAGETRRGGRWRGVEFHSRCGQGKAIEGNYAGGCEEPVVATSSVAGANTLW